MVKIIGTLISAIIVLMVVLWYVYKQNMFNIRNIFSSNKRTKDNFLMSFLTMISELGGISNIRKINFIRQKLIVNLFDSKKIIREYKKSGESIIIDQSTFSNLEERYELLNYAIKK